MYSIVLYYVIYLPCEKSATSVCPMGIAGKNNLELW